MFNGCHFVENLIGRLGVELEIFNIVKKLEALTVLKFKT